MVLLSNGYLMVLLDRSSGGGGLSGVREEGREWWPPDVKREDHRRTQRHSDVVVECVQSCVSSLVI